MRKDKSTNTSASYLPDYPQHVKDLYFRYQEYFYKKWNRHWLSKCDVNNSYEIYAQEEFLLKLHNSIKKSERTGDDYAKSSACYAIRLAAREYGELSQGKEISLHYKNEENKLSLYEKIPDRKPDYLKMNEEGDFVHEKQVEENEIRRQVLMILSACLKKSQLFRIIIYLITDNQLRVREISNFSKTAVQYDCNSIANRISKGEDKNNYLGLSDNIKHDLMLRAIKHDIIGALHLLEVNDLLPEDKQVCFSAAIEYLKECDSENELLKGIFVAYHYEKMPSTKIAAALNMDKTKVLDIWNKKLLPQIIR